MELPMRPRMESTVVGRYEWCGRAGNEVGTGLLLAPRKAQATHSARFLMGRWLRVAWRIPSAVCLRLRLSCEKSEWWGAVWKAFCIAWGPNENPHCISKAFANAFSNYFACVAFRSRAAAIALNKNNEGRLARRP